MTEDSDLNGIESVSDELATIEEPVQIKRSGKAARLAGIAFLALLLIAAVLYLTPSLRKDFLPELAAKAGLVRHAPKPPDPESLLAVPVLWQRLNLSAMPDSVAEDLRQGKYYYEKRLPGNFGLAIDYWKKALAGLEEANRRGVQRLVASAELELARQFSADSADAFVLLKQGKQAQAVALLEKMRADYLDINSPQYVWASQMLYRRRR
jgi:hypothetical protein